MRKTQPMHEIFIGDLQKGQYRLVPNNIHFPDVFIGRIAFESRLPPGALDLGGGECLIAYSRKCTHLGCALVSSQPDSGELPLEGTSIRCSCHFSSFDLEKQGLVVLGPATSFLPQVSLEAINEPITKVRLTRWIRENSVLYGVPYEGTSSQPPSE